jgi:hypothetical protein
LPTVLGTINVARNVQMDIEEIAIVAVPVAATISTIASPIFLRFSFATFAS